MCGMSAHGVTGVLGAQESLGRIRDRLGWLRRWWRAEGNFQFNGLQNIRTYFLCSVAI